MRCKKKIQGILEVFDNSKVLAKSPSIERHINIVMASPILPKIATSTFFGLSSHIKMLRYNST